MRTRDQFETIIDSQRRTPEDEARRERVLARAEAFARPLGSLTVERLKAGLPLSDGQLTLIAPQDAQWDAFTCGDTMIEARLQDEIRAAHYGVRALYELRQGEAVIAVVTLHGGEQRADPSVLESLDDVPSVPTLCIPLISVHRDHQRQGVGRQVMDVMIALARARAADFGIATLSLDSTPDSDAFFTAVGLERDEVAAPDGSRARWLLLQ